MKLCYQLSDHRSAIVFSNDSYDEGRYGKPWSGNDLDSYTRGTGDKQRSDPIHQELENRGKTNGEGATLQVAVVVVVVVE